MSTDRIEKKIFLRAPRSRVWRALTDHRDFGTWFGMKLDGPFAPGARLRGVIAPSSEDPEAGKRPGRYDGTAIEIVVDQVQAERLFSFRWHPYAVQAGYDYSKEPMTLITFTLEDQKEGILLTVTESGFDGIPLTRRAEALKANEGGWAIQLQRVETFLARQK